LSVNGRLPSPLEYFPIAKPNMLRPERLHCTAGISPNQADRRSSAWHVEYVFNRPLPFRRHASPCVEKPPSIVQRGVHDFPVTTNQLRPPPDHRLLGISPGTVRVP